MIKINEKIAICYTCCGPTYRKTTLNKLNNQYIDHPNLYYFVITDDKNYFNNITRQNFVVNELKDFYPEFPDLEKYEYFLESIDAEDYANKFIKLGYKFPFSTNRFHFKQAKEHNICNVVMLGTDTSLNLNIINDFFQDKNILCNAVSKWYQSSSDSNIPIITNILKEKYNLSVDDTLMVFDGAAKFFVFDSVEKMNQFFDIWNNIMFILYKEDKIKFFQGGYAVNDEFILAPIYNALNISRPKDDSYTNLFDVRHNPQEERFWHITN